jgi:hypothetical protein
VAIRPTAGPYDELYDTGNGAHYSPQGYNYIVLAGPGAGHSTFDVGIYDPKAADAVLERMRGDGENTVRVFLDFRGELAPGSGQFGLAGPRGTQGVHGPYLDNLADFLTRAALRNLRTVVVLNRVPDNDYFQSIFNGGQIANVDGENSLYLSPGGVAAHAELARQVVQGLADRNSALLTYVLSWELDNEPSVHTDQRPFSLDSGAVATADGASYDMADAAQRLACMDANFNNWANASAAAIRAVDPKALVSVSVFTYHAVGRAGVGPVACQQPCDVRAPPRPLALRLGSTLSVTDLHAYPDSASNYSLAADLATSEVGSPEFQRTRQPFWMGEFGAFKRFFGSPATAAQDMLAHRDASEALGFAGALFWTYDTAAQPELWNARDANAVIEGALAPDLFWRTVDAAGRHGVRYPGYAPEGFTREQLSFVLDRGLAQPGWTRLYLCLRNGQQVLQRSASCGPGQRPQRNPVAAIAPAPAAGLSAVYSCSRTVAGQLDEFLSRDAGCEGGQNHGTLGWAR